MIHPLEYFIFQIFFGTNNMAKFRHENEKIAMIRREIIPSGSTDGDTTAQNLEKKKFTGGSY